MTSTRCNSIRARSRQVETRPETSINLKRQPHALPSGGTPHCLLALSSWHGQPTLATVTIESDCCDVSLADRLNRLAAGPTGHAVDEPPLLSDTLGFTTTFGVPIGWIDWSRRQEPELPLGLCKGPLPSFHPSRCTSCNPRPRFRVLTQEHIFSN